MTATRRQSTAAAAGAGHQATSLMLDTYEACSSSPSSSSPLTQLTLTADPLSHLPVKRKHLAQNKEIIHKNSELHKHVHIPSFTSISQPADPPSHRSTRANADLQRQISLMRAERLSLKGSQYQLECDNAALRDRAERAEERERELKDERERIRRKGGGMDPDGVEVRLSSTLYRGCADGNCEQTMRLALANAIAALQAFGLMLPSSSLSSSLTSTHSLPGT